MKRNFAKIVLFGFAIVAVTFLLVRWKKQDREQALQELKALKVGVTQFSNEIHINVANPKFTDLTRLSELIERAQRLEDKTPLHPWVLDLTGSPNLRSLKGVEKLHKLRSIIAINCPKLVNANGVSGLPELIELHLTNNSSLNELSAVRDLPSLVTLDLTTCESLKQLELGELPALENIYLSGCRSIEWLDFNRYPLLKQLDLDGCIELKEIKGLENLTQLTDLFVSNCQNLEHLKGLNKLESLVVLDLRNIELPDFSVIGELPKLEVLRLAGQGTLTSLKPFSKLTSLTEIHVEASRNFTSLAGLPKTVEQYAGFTKCEKLKSIEGVEVARSLRHLDLSDCPSLEDISALAKLPELVNLSLVNCRKIKDISSLKRNQNLRFVRLSGSGVTPADVEPLQEFLKQCIFDFME